MHPHSTRKSLDERFWSKVDKSGGPDACWPWMASRWPNGYGRFGLNGKIDKAHRVAFELANGYIDPNLFVLHSCDNPPCCNPKCLSQGTPKDNSQQMVERGRARTGEKNTMHMHPELAVSGDRHWTRAHRERVPRGDTHWTHTSPEKAAHGTKAWGAKLTDEAVRDIRTRFIPGVSKLKAFSEEFGVTEGTISLVVRRKIWKHV